MKTSRVAGLLTIFCALLFVPGAQGDLFTVVDLNADPNIFECDLTADEKDVTIGGATVHAMAYKDENAAVPPASAGIPIQVIRAKVGDMILCRFKNDLDTESASIHWHGIELDNDSDGTAVTQDAVLPGQRYTYRFLTFRPGIFWFHSHMLPGNTLFGGIYGVLIIENDIESSLIANGTLPTAEYTHTIAMSDIEFDGTGKIGKLFNGVTMTENELIELCHLGAIGDPGGDSGACSLSSTPGSTVLVNGQKPDPAAETPKFVVPSGKRVRLHLLNESIARHFRVKLINSGDNKLYRIGGQGGLLDNIILEGGMKGTWDTKYNSGEIVLGSGMRADVLIVPSGSEGTIIQLVGNPLPSPFNISTGLPADYPIAYFEISGSSTDTAPAAGDAILAGTSEDIENIKTLPEVTPLIEPAPFGGSSDETMTLFTETPTGPGTYVSKVPTVDLYAPPLDSNVGNGDWLLMARPPTSRYAYVGDVLELTVRNASAGNGVHPYHLHGFSMQPVRMVDDATQTTLYEFDYDEFVDTVDVYGGQSFVFRVRIDDRPKFCDITPNVPPDPGPVLAECSEDPCGGVVGRWLFHCHIVNHGALGMIGEVTILSKPLEITCPSDITQDNDPGECGAVVTFEATASGGCGEATVEYNPPSGSFFPVGTTTVTATATDDAGEMAQCTFDVTVEDVEPPVITSSAVAISTFWSPTHDLINVGLSATATDNCPTPVTFSVAVYSDEDDELSSTGDGKFSPDAKEVALGTLRLRTERNQQGDGRVYLIIITATDGAGNTAKACHTVVVPKNQTASNVSLVNAQATAALNYCIANGAPPPDYVVVGDGPVIGSKQ